MEKMTREQIMDAIKKTQMAKFDLAMKEHWSQADSELDETYRKTIKALEEQLKEAE